MKVLLLPTNIASDLSHKVRLLKSVGVEAKGLVFGANANQTAEDVRLIDVGNTPYQRIKNRASFFAEMYKLVGWADVIHWFWSFGRTKIDKKILQLSGKPGIVQFGGSDTRIPDMDFDCNPYYRDAFHSGYEYAEFESRERSLANQKDFADLGFFPLAFIGTERYTDPKLFPRQFRTWQSVVLSDFEPSFPDPSNKRPLVIHSPTAPVAKGTRFVLEAIEALRSRCAFDFELIQGMRRDQALEKMRQCDIYIDQLIIGGHGYAAVEAMAYGKPVLSYINPEIGNDYPLDLPIVNANPDNIAEVLLGLLSDGVQRHELGLKSRDYAEKYHNDRKIALDLIATYEEVIRAGC